MNRFQGRKLIEDISKYPAVYWVLAGFLVSYLFFFVVPVFLNHDHIMKFFQYVPFASPIGEDLWYMLSYCKSWAFEHQTPYIGANLYPPLATVLFTPLLWLTPSAAFGVVTILNVLGYIFVTLIIPALIISQNDKLSLPLLLLITGLFSYGFHFELEKGQFNIVAFSFSMFAIYLYHYKPRLRYLSYVFLTLSIQLKVYPAIFVFLFVDNWLDWKKNAKRFFYILFANFLLFFALGYKVFLEFLQAILNQIINPYILMDNHSIKSFSELLFMKNGFRSFFLDLGMPLNLILDLREYVFFLQIVLLVYIIICLTLIVVRAIRFNVVGLNPYLLLACTVGALLIPSVSHDYKLSILGGPMVIALHVMINSADDLRKRLIAVFFVLTSSLAYSTTLFSFVIKPVLLQNNLPALMVILTSVTGMALLTSKRSDIGIRTALGE